MDRMTSEEIQGVIRFHGHWCPGLAIGIRAAQWALQELGRSPDEEIVAVVETDMCGVDAIQYLTGCTFGKGNLIHKDYGKNAFTFYRRRDGKALRLVTRPRSLGELGDQLARLNSKMQKQGLTPEEKQRWEAAREHASRQIMEAEPEELFEIKTPTAPHPPKARILATLLCEACGEGVMESRTRRLGGQVLCIPCFEARQGGN